MRAPSFAYPGGKHYQRRWLTSFFPEQIAGTYCEPFAGRGNIFWLTAKIVNASKWWINDLFTSDFFRCLKNSDSEKIIEAIGNSYPTKKEYASLSKEKSLRAVLCEPWITFSGGGWSQGYRHGPKAPTVRGYLSRLIAASDILRSLDVRITSCDYKDVLCSLGKDDFAYIDPPYYGCDVRSYSSRDVDHQELVKILVGADFEWVLSEYERDFYNEAFGKPASTKKESLKVSGNLVAAEHRVEVIYKNF